MLSLSTLGLKTVIVNEESELRLLPYNMIISQSKIFTGQKKKHEDSKVSGACNHLF